MRNIAVLTSGGDSPGMNAAVRAVVRVGRAADLNVFGVRRGYEGLIHGEIEEMSNSDVSNWVNSGGSKLECARSPEMYELSGQQRAVRNLREHGIDGLVVIGGDGSFRGAAKLVELGAHVIGAPGTIDNDIPGIDNTIGFDTAVNTLTYCINQLRDTAESHQRTFVVEAMGRHSGHIALHAGLSGGADIILVPEIAWSQQEVVAMVESRISQGKKFHLIVMAEGAGEVIYNPDYDAYDLVKYIDENTPATVTVRGCMPGHIQRGGAPTAADRIYATRCGKAAVSALLRNVNGVMVGELNGQMVEVPLENATQGSRPIDRELYDLAIEVS
ncbi:6-phosphofructokinase [bacterium]|nr:6-phosphofructokinase [bacterium]